jgi:hypothetical protein
MCLGSGRGDDPCGLWCVGGVYWGDGADGGTWGAGGVWKAGAVEKGGCCVRLRAAFVGMIPERSIQKSPGIRREILFAASILLLLFLHVPPLSLLLTYTQLPQRSCIPIPRVLAFRTSVYQISQLHSPVRLKMIKYQQPGPRALY